MIHDIFAIKALFAATDQIPTTTILHLPRTPDSMSINPSCRGCNVQGQDVLLNTTYKMCVV